MIVTPSCHFFGSLLANQYRPPSNPSSAPIAIVDVSQSH